MAHDLIFKSVSKNWARGTVAQTAPAVAPRASKPVKKTGRLRRLLSRSSGSNPDEGILFPSPTEIDEGWVPDEMYVATEAGGPEQDAMVRQLGWLVPRKRFFRRVKKQGQPFGAKRSGHRGQGLRLLAQRAAQGDQAARAKLQQVNTHLASKASSGDPQAVARLRRFQEEAARVSTPSPFYPSQPYPPISTTPPLSYSAPTTPAEVYLTANPAALSDEQDSYYESDEY